MSGWLLQLSWPELRHHPWRSGAALIAIALGVALAFSVHLINQSALGEFTAAVRAVHGQADLQLVPTGNGYPEDWLATVAAQPLVAAASPIVEVQATALDASGQPVALQVVGLDALVAGAFDPALLPQPRAGGDRLAVIDPGAIFLNAAARRRLGEVDMLEFRTPGGLRRLQVLGSVGAGGQPLAVMDIAGAQATFGGLGRLNRIDLRLRAGADPDAVRTALHLQADSPVRAVTPKQSTERVDNASRAYRVNLLVLALVALFTGAFLVFSIMSLSVAQRLPQLALLGVLGMGARARMGLIVGESALLGIAGSTAGLALGTALAALALKMLSGDLGGGYFPGVAPRLRFDALAAALYGALGVAAAMAGAWLPARAAQRLAPAAALKGLGDAAAAERSLASRYAGPVLLLCSALLALLPPVAEVPVFAYCAVACLLLGGIACVPAALGALLRWVPPPRHALALLAVQRARHQRDSATIAVAGVVASLSLCVALTVMVTSFRDAVTRWLDTILPADLYVRVQTEHATGDVNARGVLPAGLERAAAREPGVLRLEAQRVATVQLDAARPAVAIIARPLRDLPNALPWVGEPTAVTAGAVPVYVSEAMVMLYGARIGSAIALPLGPARAASGAAPRLIVAGVWRDYARQHGAVALRSADYARLTGDTTSTDLALWLRPGADVATLEAALRALAKREPGTAPLEFASSGEIRRQTLRIFDRSFAVTYWLQAVAIAIGLFGVAASYSAQVLARRKEFGLLAHLGFSRAQILGVVAAEGAVWTAAGAALGLVLGLGVSVVLVDVVNPQSFHWTMDLEVPWPRVLALCAAVLAAGTTTAWLAARRAAGRDATSAVKEDW